ncbi:methionine permease [Oleoguttula sp. CCFEE 5521]
MGFFSHPRNPSSKEVMAATCDRDFNSDTAADKGHHDVARTNKRQIGVISASFLIFNRMIGMLIAAAVMVVYLEFGTALLRGGGEKNYLDNSVVFGEYILHAEQIERGVGLAYITAAFLIHGLALKWGLRSQNLLGVIKLIIILIIVVAGWAALGGALKVEKPHNFGNAFEGTTGSSYGVVTALYNVIWSYTGYSNANYALSETKNPVKTLKITGPLALGTVTVLYMFVNIAYFAAVPKEEILSSGFILAASFFRNVFGERAERAERALSPLAIVNTFVALGLILLYTHRTAYDWNPPFRATLPVVIFFFLSNVYLVVAPFIPPDDGQSIYESLPYWLHCVVGWGIFAGGGLYWLIWAKIVPKIGKYELVREATVDSVDGWERHYFVRKPLGAVAAEY